MSKIVNDIPYTVYQDRFNELIKQKNPKVYIKTGKRSYQQVDIPNSDPDYWKQCYSPEDTLRKLYPKYIFVSKAGDIISVRGKIESSKTYPRLLMDTYTTKRVSHKFSVNGKPRSQMAHITTAIVWGAEKVGNAEELLEKYNFDALTEKYVNVHHINGYKEYPKTQADKEYNCNPAYLEFLPKEMHDVVHKIPAEDAGIEEQLKYMKTLINNNHSDSGTIFTGKNKGEAHDLIAYAKKHMPHFVEGDYFIFPNAQFLKAMTSGKFSNEQVQSINKQLINHCKSMTLPDGLQHGTWTKIHTNQVGDFNIYRV